MQAALRDPMDFIQQLVLSGAEMLLPVSKALLRGKLRALADSDGAIDTAKAIELALARVNRAIDAKTPDLIGAVFEKCTGGDPMKAVKELLAALGGDALGGVLALVCLAARAPLRLIDAIDDLQFDEEMFEKIKEAGPKLLEYDIVAAIATVCEDRRAAGGDHWRRARAPQA